MSGSAALEYGFPSTHSTNAVSVAVYGLAILNCSESTLSPRVNLCLQALTYVYVVSVVLGRLYCGMHGFFDVFIGCLLGALIGALQFAFEGSFEESLASADGWNVLLLIFAVLVLVRIHPEPADDCPCFDDSVAFAGVLLGTEVAYWHCVKHAIIWADPSVGYEETGTGQIALRILLGVIIIFVWREVMKPSLLLVLPPIFRGLEKLGLILPRRFFTNASYVIPSRFLSYLRMLLTDFQTGSILPSLRSSRMKRSFPNSPKSRRFSRASAILDAVPFPLVPSLKQTRTKPWHTVKNADERAVRTVLVLHRGCCRIASTTARAHRQMPGHPRDSSGQTS